MLLEGNEGLQQRVRQVLDLRNKGRTVVTGGLSQLEGADTRYRCDPTTNSNSTRDYICPVQQLEWMSVDSSRDQSSHRHCVGG